MKAQVHFQCNHKRRIHCTQTPKVGRLFSRFFDAAELRCTLYSSRHGILGMSLHMSAAPFPARVHSQHLLLSVCVTPVSPYAKPEDSDTFRRLTSSVPILVPVHPLTTSETHCTHRYLLLEYSLPQRVSHSVGFIPLTLFPRVRRSI